MNKKIKTKCMSLDFCVFLKFHVEVLKKPYLHQFLQYFSNYFIAHILMTSLAYVKKKNDDGNEPDGTCK